MDEITKLLQAWSKGDKRALEKLMPLVNEELKKIAKRYMGRERPGHILQTTALVNEALIRLIRESVTDWEDRQQFYGLVAKRMRQVLIDDAKKRSAAKRGKAAQQIDDDGVKDPSSEKSNDLIRLDEALTALAKFDERKAKIVEYRFFIGLTLKQISEQLGIGQSTVEREWRFARSWLKRQMTGNS